MKKFLVIGNPIEHSLSPQLHNFWIKNNNLNATYTKKKLNDDDLEKLISEMRENNLNGINVTVPFKKKIIPYLDELSKEAKETESVNTIYLKDDKIKGHNTDVSGFEYSIKDLNINMNNKKVLIIGAGGVVSSILFALNKMSLNKIFITNRTRKKAEDLKKFFKNLIIVEWGDIPDFDMVINATSVGLNENDQLELNLSKIKNKFFYDIIYNPPKTNFLKNAEVLGNKIENGKKMFIYQAAAAFKIWHNIQPEINNKVFKVLDK